MEQTFSAKRLKSYPFPKYQLEEKITFQRISESSEFLASLLLSLGTCGIATLKSLDQLFISVCNVEAIFSRVETEGKIFILDSGGIPTSIYFELDKSGV